LEAPAESFWNLPEFDHHIQFVVFHGCETCSLEAHFQSGEQPTITPSEMQRVRLLDDDRNCCTTSDVWLGASSWCRNHCPCLPLPPNCIVQPPQNLHVEMISNALSRRYKLMEHHTVNVTEFHELVDLPSYLWCSSAMFYIMYNFYTLQIRTKKIFDSDVWYRFSKPVHSSDNSILKGSDNGVQLSELQSFCILPNVQHSKNYGTQCFGKFCFHNAVFSSL
jgi:hypothetical protein